MSWEELADLSREKNRPADLVNGPTTSQARLRLFGRSEASDVRVTLYRDHHAWCPYCQKVWLWLEEKRVPYRVEKVTMFCYGEKEAWYKRLCPRGMLPALQLDGRLLTESDDIIAALEREFGPLHTPFEEPAVRRLRNLERSLFSAWCRWLCYEAMGAKDEEERRQGFVRVAKMMDRALADTPGPFFLDEFSVVDCVFVPYVERMNASLFYYKGFVLRDRGEFPNICRWFEGLEQRETYRGTQSDFHTHCHDLPPQMGGCYESGDGLQAECRERVDSCVDFTIPETGVMEPRDSRVVALDRFLKHRENIVKVNPLRHQEESLDVALRSALSWLVRGREGESGHKIAPGLEVGLRYIRDRINVPRDMLVWSARRLREALEMAATTSGSNKQSQAIPTNHRRDQDPKNFGK